MQLTIPHKNISGYGVFVSIGGKYYQYDKTTNGYWYDTDPPKNNDETIYGNLDLINSNVSPVDPDFFRSFDILLHTNNKTYRKFYIVTEKTRFVMSRKYLIDSERNIFMWGGLSGNWEKCNKPDEIHKKAILGGNYYGELKLEYLT